MVHGEGCSGGSWSLALHRGSWNDRRKAVESAFESPTTRQIAVHAKLYSFSSNHNRLPTSSTAAALLVQALLPSKSQLAFHTHQMADSDSSSLSSAPSTDDEAMELKMSKPTGLDRYFKPAPKTKETTPEPPRRAPSPPHEYTLIDNETIAFLVMFRSRFGDAFPKSLPHYGPQDIERGVAGELPDESVEKYLCALLGLVLNRKKDVE